MAQRAHDLLQEALSLSKEERAVLACCLMESLDSNLVTDAEGAWNQEIARRIEDLNSGNAKTVSWQKIRRRISARLTHCV